MTWGRQQGGQGRTLWQRRTFCYHSRSQATKISLIFVARTKWTIRFDDTCNHMNNVKNVLAREIEAVFPDRSQIGYFRDSVHRRENSFSMPQKKRKTKSGDSHAVSPLRPLRILERSDSSEIFDQRTERDLRSIESVQFAYNA